MSISTALPRTAKIAISVAASVTLALSAAGTAEAGGQGRDGYGGHNPGHSQHDPRYTQVNLVSDVPGRAALTDPNLINAWGLSASPTSPVWVSDNGTGVSTLYLSTPPTRNPLVVAIPGGAPTGTVFNGTAGFVLSTDGKTGSARFLFAAETGDISGWNPTGTATQATVVVHTPGANYKGLALIPDAAAPRLLAANFASGRVDVFDSAFQPVLDRHAFRGIGIPHGYAPFNVAVVGGRVLVSYAKQDSDAEDDVAGPGHGFINVYDLHGKFQRHLVRRGRSELTVGHGDRPRRLRRSERHPAGGQLRRRPHSCLQPDATANSSAPSEARTGNRW